MERVKGDTGMNQCIIQNSQRTMKSKKYIVKQDDRMKISHSGKVLEVILQTMHSEYKSAKLLYLIFYGIFECNNSDFQCFH